MKPEGWHAVTSRLVVNDPAGLVAFLITAFGARGEYEADRPSVLRIDDSNIMISSTAARPATAAFLHLYVDDADAMYASAVKAGATTVEEPADTPWGDRRAMVADPFGNYWQIATYRG